MNITSISSGRNILSLAKEVFHFANFVKCWIPIYQKNNINISMELQYLEKWNARIQTAWVGSDHSNALSFYRSQNVLGWSNFLCQTNARQKKWFAFSKIGFCAITKVFEEAINAVKFLGWHKIFRPAQNILWPVKGQGRRLPQHDRAHPLGPKSAWIKIPHLRSH